LTNYSIYRILKEKESLIELLVYCILIFLGIAFVAKIYDFSIHTDSMPKSGSIFIFLSFSWGISVMNLIKKYNNRRVDLYKQLNLVEYIGEITFLKFFTILITVFQIYLIFSKTIYELN
jgi:hypothetical protein